MHYIWMFAAGWIGGVYVGRGTSTFKLYSVDPILIVLFVICFYMGLP